jgi:hypothetical protein
MTRTYRNSIVVPAAAIVIALFAVVMSCRSAYYLATGDPLIFHRPSDGPQGHVASRQELINGTFIPVIALVVCGFVVLGWKNQSIELDNGGILQRNLMGAVSFRSNWKDLSEAATTANSRGRRYYTISSRTSMMRFLATTGNLIELLGEVKRHANHLDFDAWP